MLKGTLKGTVKSMGKTRDGRSTYVYVQMDTTHRLQDDERLKDVCVIMSDDMRGVAAGDTIEVTGDFLPLERANTWNGNVRWKNTPLLYGKSYELIGEVVTENAGYENEQF